MTCGDIDFGRQTITVVSKGTRVREPVPVSPDALVWIRLWLAEGLVWPVDEPLPADALLWVTLRRPIRPLTYSAIRRVLQRALAATFRIGIISHLQHQMAYSGEVTDASPGTGDLVGFGEPLREPVFDVVPIDRQALERDLEQRPSSLHWAHITGRLTTQLLGVTEINRVRTWLEAEDVSGLAVQDLAECGQCREPDGLGSAVLEDRQVHSGHSDQLREFGECHASVGQQPVEVHGDRRFQVVRGRHTVPSRSSRITEPTLMIRAAVISPTPKKMTVHDPCR